MIGRASNDNKEGEPEGSGPAWLRFQRRGELIDHYGNRRNKLLIMGGKAIGWTALFVVVGEVLTNSFKNFLRDYSFILGAKPYMAVMAIHPLLTGVFLGVALMGLLFTIKKIGGAIRRTNRAAAKKGIDFTW